MAQAEDEDLTSSLSDPRIQLRGLQSHLFTVLRGRARAGHILPGSHRRQDRGGDRDDTGLGNKLLTIMRAMLMTGETFNESLVSEQLVLAQRSKESVA